MDWLELGKKLAARGLPLLGTALGGPAGGAAGGLIASALGLASDQPEVLYSAIQQDPEAVVKLRQVELRHAERLEEISLESIQCAVQAESSRIQAVNLTMRAEAGAEHWPQYSWRPYWGFVSATAFLVVCVFVCILGYQAVIGGKPEALSMIPQLVTSMAALFAIPGAILGVTAWHRGKAQRLKVNPLEDMQPARTGAQ